MAGLEAPDEGTAASHGRVGYLAQTHRPAGVVHRGRRHRRTPLRRCGPSRPNLTGWRPAWPTPTTNELETYGQPADPVPAARRLRRGVPGGGRVGPAGPGRPGPAAGAGLALRRRTGTRGLACVLADPADILLLDEPTNHLDASGTAWLEARLAAHRGTVVVVSHDRVLLRKVATSVIEVDAERCAVNRYGNGYDGYLREKAAERERWVQQYRGWIDAMAAERLQADTVADKMGYARRRDGDKMGFDFKAGTWQQAATSKVRNAQERLRRLEASPVDRPPVPLRLKLAVDCFGGGVRRGPGDGGLARGADPGAGTAARLRSVLSARGVAPGRLLPGCRPAEDPDHRPQRRRQINAAVRAGRHPGTGRRHRAAASAGSAICSRSWNCRTVPGCGFCRPSSPAWAATSTSMRRRCCGWASSGPPNSMSRSEAFPPGSSAGSPWPGCCWAASDHARGRTHQPPGTRAGGAAGSGPFGIRRNADHGQPRPRPRASGSQMRRTVRRRERRRRRLAPLRDGGRRAGLVSGT